MSDPDLTLLYYTANRISDHFSEAVRVSLVEVGKDYPIISISHKPMDFGKNVCMGKIVPSNYNIYKQLLIGALLVDTPYLACIEDDSLYTAEHLAYRPPPDTIAYNINRWNVDTTFFYYRRRAGLCMCIAPTETMIKTLSERFNKYPHFLQPDEMVGWGEPGRCDKRMGLTPIQWETFQTVTPTLTFNHPDSMGGKRKILYYDKISEELEGWGKASDLWRSVYG